MEPSAVVKVFKILEVLSGDAGPLPLNVLAREAGMPKPTIYRILRKMCDIGYVDRSDGGVYELTSKIRSLFVLPVDRRLVNASSAELEELHNKLDETVNLGILRDEGIIYLRVLETKRALRRVVETGCVDPFHCTALGRAILAHLPEEHRASLLNENTLLKKVTPETVVDLAKLRDILEDVRRLGYAVERDETDIGVTCISAPIFLAKQVIGAISLSAPSVRLHGESENNAIRAVKKAAGNISVNISAGPSTNSAMAI